MLEVSVHEPVLLQEVIEGFRPKLSDEAIWYLDGTLGGAGHAKAVLRAFGGNLIGLVGLDQDVCAIDRARDDISKAIASSVKDASKRKLIFECENFRNLDKVLRAHSIDKIDLILFDLGVSSDELETSGKGFSFIKDEPLLMTLGDPAKFPFTAKDIVNDWSEENISNVIFGYGEERFARRIARAIVNYRTKKTIETTHELVEIVKMSVPAFYRNNIIGKKKRIHPATKTFQALRIAVNDELNALKEGLNKGYEALNTKGRMAVISFHSLEDRIVKEFYKKRGKEGALVITKKPITATDQEIAENPRSRSAKLRVIEKY